MTRRQRVIGASLVATSVAAAGIWIALDYRYRPQLVWGPMIQMATPSGFTLVWQMHPAKPVRVRVSEHAGAQVVFDAVIEQHDLQYEASINGLKVGQTYDYTIGSQPETWTTQTAVGAGRAFRFLAFGDSGTGRSKQYRVAHQFDSWRPDLVVHTGDLIYPDGERKDYFKKFFLPYAKLISSAPFYPCLGNHDVHTQKGAPFLETFVLPENGPVEQIERCYWFDFGDVRFVAIDSNGEYEHFRDVVAPWLDQALTQAEQRWRIIYFHEPMYTHGKYQEAKKLIDSIGPIIDRHQVELVLSGHDHMYERTHPIRAGQVALDGEGTVHVTTGAGGAGLYKQRPDRPSYLAAFDDSQHSFTVVDVTPDWLNVRQIGEDDRPIDEAHIPRRSSPPAATQPV